MIDVEQKEYDHPKLGRLFVTIINNDPVAVVSNKGFVDFDFYNELLCVENYVTQVDSNEFIRSGL